ncbi:MAG: cyclic peptide export ABC transporter [Flavobacteriales bacterium]
MITEKPRNILQLFRAESKIPEAKLILATLVSGISNILLLIILNTAAESIGPEISFDRLWLLLVFIIVFVLFYFGKKMILVQGCVLVANIITNIRLRIMNKIRKANLRSLENVGQSEVFTRISEDVSYISHTTTVIVNALQSAVMILCSLFYIGFLSLEALGLTLIAFAISFLIYKSKQKAMAKAIKAATVKETEFFASLDDVIDGFKEINIHQKKNDAVYNNLKKITEEARGMKIETESSFVAMFMFSQSVFYILIAVIVFFMPLYADLTLLTATKIIAALLFIIGPLEGVMTTIPLITQANVAIKNIYALEERFDSILSGMNDQNPDQVVERFKTIELNNVSFNYLDKKGVSNFKSGPFNLTIEEGKIIFLVGGNGSGKSTLLKVLTGIYELEQGEIKLDGKVVTAGKMPQYKSLFSAIFTDFYLFDRIFGVDEVSDQKIEELIDLLQMSEKVSFEEGKFSTIHLSTGQRKRLALITVILENRPFFILDEVAADQDPEFKRYFYHTLLSRFKKEGRTVLVVSHDENYFSVADRILKMENGQIISDINNEKKPK